MDNSKLKDLNNQDLRKEILEINNRQMLTIKKSAYLNIIYTGLLMDEIKKNLGLEEESLKLEELKRLDKIALDRLESLDKLKMEGEQRDILEDRGYIWELSRSLTGYLGELYFLRELIEGHSLKSIEGFDKPYGIDQGRRLNLSLEKVKMALEASKSNHWEYIYIISELISLVPMSLTKEKYFTLINETLTRNFKNYSETRVKEEIEKLKVEFNSSLCEGYGIYFDQIFIKIESLKKKDLKNLSKDDYLNLAEEVNSLISQVNSILNYVMTIGLINNMALSIVSNSKDLGQDLDKLIDSYKANKGQINKIYLKELRQEIEAIEARSESDVKDFESLNMEAFIREDFPHSSLENDLEEARKALTYYNDRTFVGEDLLFAKDFKSIERESLEIQIKGLVDYINRNIKLMPNIERKIRMRRLLSKIELPFKGLDEFLTYLTYSLDLRLISKEEIDIRLDKIDYFLSELEKIKTKSKG